MLDIVRDYIFKSFKNYSGPLEEQFKRKNIFFCYNGKGKFALARGILEELKNSNILPPIKLKTHGELIIRIINERS